MPHDVIHVDFVDNATQQVFTSADLPLAQLPASFTQQTTLNLGGDAWQVVKAEPAAAADYAASGTLRLTLAKVLYSVPTICNKIPPTQPNTPVRGKTFRMHQSNWRQIDFIAEQYRTYITGEFAQILAVRQNHKVGAGFDQIHVRADLPNPLGRSFKRSELDSLLSLDGTFCDSLTYDDAGDAIAGGFAWDMGAMVVYGCEERGIVTQLGFQTDGRNFAEYDDLIDVVTGVLQVFDLLLVDWLRLRTAGENYRIVWDFLL